MIGQVSIPAATAVLGYDLAASTTWRVSGQHRRIIGAGLAGSAAALDSKVDLFIGEMKVGELHNTSTGAVQRNTDIFRIGQRVPAGSPVSAKVVDAPATNPLNLTIDFE